MTVIAAPERWLVARGGIRDSWKHHVQLDGQGALAKEDGREAVMSFGAGSAGQRAPRRGGRGRRQRRLGEAVKEMAVNLALAPRKGRWS